MRPSELGNVADDGSAAVVITALYVPGDRPDRFDKALDSDADVVIFDLEDAVAPTRKEAARQEVVEALSQIGDRGRISVRLNSLSSPWGEPDLASLAEVMRAGGPPLSSIRLPKVESHEDVLGVRSALGGLETPLAVVVETALGVENLFEIASAPTVGGVSLGEADLRSDLGMADSGSLDWCRTRLVVAARAARLPSPMMAVHPWLDDDEGLIESCRWGRRHGFLGRAAIHPRQLPGILAGFRPSEREVNTARELLAALNESHRLNNGVAVLPDGRMADAAMAESARTVVALYARTER